ncbi:hypothetical protein BVRB_028620, partial [Beta vulgaris subsp. vulgaris]
CRCYQRLEDASLYVLRCSIRVWRHCKSCFKSG